MNVSVISEGSFVVPNDGEESLRLFRREDLVREMRVTRVISGPGNIGPLAKLDDSSGHPIVGVRGAILFPVYALKPVLK